MSELKIKVELDDKTNIMSIYLDYGFQQNFGVNSLIEVISKYLIVICYKGRPKCKIILYFCQPTLNWLTEVKDLI